MKRLIIFVHRWVGIPMSVVFVIWFVSGIVMIYTGGMPALDDSTRYRGQGAIDFDAVAISPAQAAAIADIEGNISELSLGNRLGRPAYRVGRGFGPPMTVFADNGEIFNGADPGEALAEAARFVGQPATAVRFVDTIEDPDQWTIGLAGSLPLDRFDVDDGAGTQVYFSRQTGRVELVTDRLSRALAWAGAIPHWFYVTPLRTQQTLWYRTVVWAAIIGCIMAVLGLILAFTQFRRSKPFRLAASVRYRGWMRWHYYTGALFGLFALTWAFSGLMSMEPFDWTNATGMRLPRTLTQGGTLELERYPLNDRRFVAAAGDAVAEVELMHIQGSPFFSVTQVPGTAVESRRLIDAATLNVRHDPFPVEPILEAIEAAEPVANIVEHSVLENYDSYYYTQGDAAPLPVLRVKFDDPASTWYYFDLTTSTAIASNHALSRVERWLFNGLHSLDFGFWYWRRPLWDVGMILLSIGALATSAIGMFLGFKRLAGRSRQPERRSA